MKTIKQMADELDTLRYSGIGYKGKFHTAGKAFLKAFVKELGIEKPYNIYSNKGGYAVLGDVILHTNHLYVCLGEYNYWRTCDCITDYSGHTNHEIKYASDILKIDYESIKLMKAEQKLRGM
jgi:hypothetical protein